MAANSILQELYAARTQIMAEFGNDLGAYLRDAAERSKNSGHPVAQIKQRAIRRSTPANSVDVSVENCPSLPCDR